MLCRGFDELTLLEYSLGRLPTDETERIRLHAAHCPICQATLAELRGLAGELETARQASQTDVADATRQAVLTASRAALPDGTPIVRAVPILSPMSPLVEAQPPRPLVSTVAPLRPSTTLKAPASWLNWRVAAAAAVLAAGAGLAMLLWQPPHPPEPRDAWAELDARLAAGGKLADLREPLRRAAGEAVLSAKPDVASAADLEWAGWVCALSESQGEPTGPRGNAYRATVARLVEQTRRRRASGGSATVSKANSLVGTRQLVPLLAAGPGVGSGPTVAESAEDRARRHLTAGEPDAALSALGTRTGREAELLRAWAWRARPEPDWARTAEAVGRAAKVASSAPSETARLRLLEGLYRWQADDRSNAETALRTAAELDNGLWPTLAFVYRWGLGDAARAAWALLRFRDELGLQELARHPGWAGLPLLLFPTDPDSPRPIHPDDWWLSRTGLTGPTRWAFDSATGVYRQLERSDQSAELLTLARNYQGRQSDYSVQLDFRLDAVAERAADAHAGEPAAAAAVRRSDAGPQLSVIAYWLDRQHSYRLRIRPDSIQFCKRRPRLDGEAETAPETGDPNFVEFLLPTAGAHALREPLTPGRWYTVKFRLDSLGGGDRPSQTRLSAKLWPRWSAEPRDWQLVDVDDGRLGGSPAHPGGRIGLATTRAAVSVDAILCVSNR